MNKISVILTTYNVEKYIEQCINSILNQTIKQFELIILDDGSKDNTVNIIETNYPKLKIIKNSHLGVAKERNLGIELSTGEYLCFLDSDDYFESDMLEKLYNSIIKNNSDISISKAYKFDTNTNDEIILNYMLNSKITNDLEYKDKEELYDGLFQLTVANAWAKMFKKSIINRYNIRFQNLHNSNDVFFVYSYMVNANRISFIDDSLVHYRFNNSNSIQGSKQKYPFEFLKAYAELQKYLIENNLYELYKQSFITMIISIMIWNLKTTNNKKVIELINNIYYDYFKIDEVVNRDEIFNLLIKMLGR